MNSNLLAIEVLDGIGDDTNMSTITTSELDKGISFMFVFRLVQKFLVSYCSGLFIILGISGNLLSILIFIKRRKQDRVSAQYLSCLAVSDLITLAVVAVPVWLYVNLASVTGGRLAYPRHMPYRIACKFWVYVWNVATFMSGWIIITFGVERCLVIWQPLKMAAYFSSSKPRRNALITLLVISILLCCIHFKTQTLKSTYPDRDLPQQCLIREDIHNWEKILTLLISFGLANGIPVLFIAIVNLLILVGIRRNTMTEGKWKNHSKADIRTLKNLMLISTSFVIYETPFVVTFNLFYYFESRGFRDFTMQGWKDYMQMMGSADAFQYMNYSSNPFLYTFALDYYRTEVKKILGFCCCQETNVKVKKSNFHFQGSTYIFENFSAVNAIRTICNTLDVHKHYWKSLKFRAPIKCTLKANLNMTAYSSDMTPSDISTETTATEESSFEMDSLTEEMKAVSVHDAKSDDGCMSPPQAQDGCISPPQAQAHSSPKLPDAHIHNDSYRTWEMACGEPASDTERSAAAYALNDIRSPLEAPTSMPAMERNDVVTNGVYVNGDNGDTNGFFDLNSCNSAIEGACGGAEAPPGEILIDGVQPEGFVVPLPWCPHLELVNPLPPEGLDVTTPCGECGTRTECWSCLTCYQVYCGRFVNEHMLLHGITHEHYMVLSYADLSVWCYGCDSYVNNEVVFPMKRAAHIDKFKIDVPCSF